MVHSLSLRKKFISVLNAVVLFQNIWLINVLVAVPYVIFVYFPNSWVLENENQISAKIIIFGL